MKASELIKQLQNAMEIVGDLQVKVDSAGLSYQKAKEVTTYKDYIGDGEYMLSQSDWSEEGLGKSIIIEG